MEVRTVMLMLSVGSFLFGLLLVTFKLNNKNPQNVPFWISAKILQGVGSLFLFLRTDAFDKLTFFANTCLLLGCAYEAWAIRFLSGRSTRRSTHLITSAVILTLSVVTLFIDSPYRSGVVFILQSVFYFLPGIFLFASPDRKQYLQFLLAVCYCISGSVFLICGIVCIAFPDYVAGLKGSPLLGIIPGASFCIFLISGFILLMLAKERSDMLVREIQEDLKKSEIRFQRIVETSIEGILIFDENYRITFSNNNMASMLGYTVEEMTGQAYRILFPESQLDVFKYQESLRKSGKDSVYECLLKKKDGTVNWFLISAKAILNDSGKFEGSFAMLTDINERKEMELLLETSNKRLTELSNRDSLTGIANRRCFDTTLKREYLRLSRTGSKLSVIMFDIDFFKDYNDFYGHVSGDECLRQIGKVLASCINRTVDLAARYGGEEFACILPDVDIETAVENAENIRMKIMELGIEHKRSFVSECVTASFGVTTFNYSADRSLEDILSTVDRLLYKAKVNGRNRTEYES